MIEDKSYYARELRKNLPIELFHRVPNRLIWLAAHVALIAIATTLIATRTGGYWLAIPLSILIGNSFGSLAFVAHEILHGAVIRGRRMQMVLGWIAFLPFTISPRLWIAWHNRAHHGHTMITSGADPDAGCARATYDAALFTRICDRLTVGRRRPAGALLFLIGFNGQNLRVLFSMARQLDYLSRPQFALAVVETFFATTFWVALGFIIGAGPFLFAFVIPLMIGNLVVMSYILTNHNLNPLTELNDPLLNSLSVTVPRLLEMVHLNFGSHVEHHIFPSMSSTHARQVRGEILRLWPERYQSMPLFRALIRLWATARIYADNETLVDPKSGLQWDTLRPRPQRP